MTTRSDDKTRVLIAVTEFSPVDALWRAALQFAGETQSEMTAVFVRESHWHRAASLPFTREISRLSGSLEKFTPQRAEQVHRDAIERVRALLHRLATESNRAIDFEVIAGIDQPRLVELASRSTSVLIVPSQLMRQPLFAELKKLHCRIEFVGITGEPVSEAESGR